MLNVSGMNNSNAISQIPTGPSGSSPSNISPQNLQQIMNLQRIMTQSVLNGGSGHPKTQMINFKKPKINGSNKQVKAMMNAGPGYGLKKSNALSRSVQGLPSN